MLNFGRRRRGSRLLNESAYCKYIVLLTRSFIHWHLSVRFVYSIKSGRDGPTSTSNCCWIEVFFLIFFCCSFVCCRRSSVGRSWSTLIFQQQQPSSGISQPWTGQANEERQETVLKRQYFDRWLLTRDSSSFHLSLIRDCLNISSSSSSFFFDSFFLSLLWTP